MVSLPDGSKLMVNYYILVSAEWDQDTPATAPFSIDVWSSGGCSLSPYVDGVHSTFHDLDFTGGRIPGLEGKPTLTGEGMDLNSTKAWIKTWYEGYAKDEIGWKEDTDGGRVALADALVSYDVVLDLFPKLAADPGSLPEMREQLSNVEMEAVKPDADWSAFLAPPGVPGLRDIQSITWQLLVEYIMDLLPDPTKPEMPEGLEPEHQKMWRSKVEETMQKQEDTCKEARKSLAMCILDFDALCGTGMAEDKELHNELRLLVGLKEKPIVPEPCGEAERLWAYLVDEEVPEAELEQCTDLDKDATSLIKLGLSIGKLPQEEQFEYASPHVKALRKKLIPLIESGEKSQQDVDAAGFDIGQLETLCPLSAEELAKIAEEHKPEEVMERTKHVFPKKSKSKKDAMQEKVKVFLTECAKRDPVEVEKKAMTESKSRAKMDKKSRAKKDKKSRAKKDKKSRAKKDKKSRAKKDKKSRAKKDKKSRAKKEKKSRSPQKKREWGDVSPTKAPGLAPGAVAASHVVDIKPEARQPVVPPMDHTEVIKMVNTLWSRYDLDDSGTLNSTEELRNMFTAMLFKMKISMNQDLMTSVLNSAPECSDNNSWIPEDFTRWYIGAVSEMNQ